MEPIPVPAPPKSAFNKQRPPSDLLLGQLKHFQHLDVKHTHGIDPALARDIGTEAGAARYIAAMTRSIRTRALAAGKGTVSAATVRPRLQVVSRSAAGAGAGRGFDIAAGAEGQTPGGGDSAAATAKRAGGKKAGKSQGRKKS